MLRSMCPIDRLPMFRCHRQTIGRKREILVASTGQVLSALVPLAQSRAGRREARTSSFFVSGARVQGAPAIMRPVHTFSVIPSLPPVIEGLRDVAFNLRWCWSHESIELFRRLDRDLWEASGHNPVLMLGTIEQAKLEAAAADDAFLAHLHRVESNLNTYLGEKKTWFSRSHGQESDIPLIAYFSAEFGLTECLSIFASDLGIPLVAVGLLYQQGYFRQYLGQSGWQQEAYTENDFHNLPLSVVYHPDGKPVTIEVDLAG